jgi:hypothetical protein
MSIYKITNLLNNKIYVGKLKDTSVFETYWGSGILIQRTITRYGIENFKKEILEEVADANINDRERYWIKLFNAYDIKIGYNLTEGGEGGDVFSKKPDYLKNITRKNMSKARKGMKQTPEWIKNRIGMITGPRNGMFGKKLSEVTRKKISLKLKGRKFTETHKKNMSNSKIGNKNPIYKILADPKKYRNFVNKMSAVTSGSNNPRALKIIRSDMHGNETLKEATLSIASTDKNIYYQSRKIKEAIANNMLHKEHKWKFAE